MQLSESVLPQRKAEMGILFLPAIWTSSSFNAPSAVDTQRVLRPSHVMVPGGRIGAFSTGWAENILKS